MTKIFKLSHRLRSSIEMDLVLIAIISLALAATAITTFIWGYFLMKGWA